MSKTPTIFLKHILDSIDRIERFTKGISRKDFFENELVQSAVVRQIEIIGEAVKNLPHSITKKYPHVPWSEITGTRDKMIHHYFGVDIDFIYKIIEDNIPQLKKEITIILENERID